ncbi:MAG: PspC domain-containing protein [Oscillospiraceae bacterium]|nr:PspC domain-containing protein [Oscillospiraceae bacterium]
MEKKLYRSNTNKKIAGVCAGLAEYLNIDPTIIRLIWALVSLFAGAGIIAYLVCALVIPEKPDNIIDAQ